MLLAIVAVFVLLVGFGQRTATIPDAVRNGARQDGDAFDEADPQYELEIVHRQFVGLAREFDSTEAKLGVIALAAVALMPVYFADPRTLSDRILEMCLVTAATVAALGFMLFRGYDAFVPLELQRAYRAEGRLRAAPFLRQDGKRVPNQSQGDPGKENRGVDQHDPHRLRVGNRIDTSYAILTSRNRNA